MIENERQYDITREWIAKFGEALEAVRGKLAVVEDSTERWKLQVFEDAIRSQLADLEADVANCERVHPTTGASAQPTEDPYPLTEISRFAADMGVADLSKRHDWYAHGRDVDDGGDR